MNLKRMKHLFESSRLKAAKVDSFPYDAKNPNVPFFSVVLSDGTTRDLVSVHERLRPWYEALAMAFNKFSKLMAVVEASLELVRLKNLKESIEENMKILMGDLSASEIAYVRNELALMKKEYEARKEPAWEALRKALAELEED